MFKLTKQNLKDLPALGVTNMYQPENTPVPVKLFNPCGGQTWYLTEYDPETWDAFGYVTGMACDELGYFNLDELNSLRGPLGLGIERDLYWNPKTTLAQVMAKERI